MIPKIIDFFSPDIPNLREWTPDKPEDLYYYLELTIGSENGKGDLFGITVLSPQAAIKRTDKAPIFNGRYHLVVARYKWDDVFENLTTTVSSCDAPTWEKAASKLARYFQWEFDEYRAG